MQVERPVGYGFKSKVLCGIEVKFNKRAKTEKKGLNTLYTSVGSSKIDSRLFFILLTGN